VYTDRTYSFVHVNRRQHLAVPWPPAAIVYSMHLGHGYAFTTSV
jgi:hypothetical protein